MDLINSTYKILAAQMLTILLVLLSFGVSSAAIANARILVWGDSLSAAYGISVKNGWVNLLKKELADEAVIINGSISGETTQGGLTRLPAALKRHKPDLIILELGANDGLRGFPPRVIKSNLQKMIEKSRQAGAQVILLGMRIPPNYGKAYSRQFESVFSSLAKTHQLPFIPFFLEKVITDLSLLQEDELHPTAAAQPLLLREILPTIKQTLKLKAESGHASL